MRFSFVITMVFIIASVVGCVGNVADEAENRGLEKLQEEAVRQTGMPNIINFTEKKNLKWIYELCDREGFTTYTYIVDLNGKLHFLCESIGYGVPYSAQYVNPEKIVSYAERVNLPQAEPNGLFKPTSSDATWVIAATKDGPAAIYVEQRIVVSPFKLEQAVD
jgi:hypothetical protein